MFLKDKGPSPAQIHPCRFPQAPLHQLHHLFFLSSVTGLCETFSLPSSSAACPAGSAPIHLTPLYLTSPELQATPWTWLPISSYPYLGRLPSPLGWVFPSYVLLPLSSFGVLVEPSVFLYSKSGVLVVPSVYLYFNPGVLVVPSVYLYSFSNVLKLLDGFSKCHGSVWAPQRLSLTFLYTLAGYVHSECGSTQ